MARPKRTLAEADPNAKAPAAKKAAAGKKMESATKGTKSATSKDGTSASKKVEAPAFLTMCRPGWDLLVEKEKTREASGWEDVDSDDNDNEEEQEEIEEVEDDSDDEGPIGCSKDCMCNKPAKDHTDWIWIITEAGFKLFKQWQIQAGKRDQGAFEMHVYNDFTAYGLTEVMENQLLAFDKEISKKSPSPIALWSVLESIGMFLTQEIEDWYGGDDSDGMAEMVMIFGTMVLTTLDILREHNMLQTGTDAPIKNLPLILSLFILFVEEWKGIGGDMGKGETYWPREVVRISDKNGVEIKGPVGVEDTVKKLREEVEENGSEISDEDDGKDKATSGDGKKSKGGKWTPKDDYEGEERQWFKWDWKLEFAAFYKDHRKQDEYTGKYFLGGGHHDITKFSKADKKRYTY